MSRSTHRGAQRRRQLLQRLPQQPARSRCSSAAIRPALGGRRREVAGVDVAVDRLALLAHAAVVIDAQVAADADQPGLEIGPPVEGVERLEHLEEDVLRQVLGFVVLADELVGDVEHLAPVQPDDRVPRRLVAAQTALESGCRASAAVRRTSQRTCGMASESEAEADLGSYRSRRCSPRLRRSADERPQQP